MNSLNIDITKAGSESADIIERVQQSREMVVNETGVGGEFLGWRDLPRDYDKEEFARIKEAASYIQKNAQVLIVIGIGGSYLGAHAVIEALSDPFHLLSENPKTPKVLYAGNHIDGVYLDALIRVVREHDVCLNIISKSGTTLEPALAFRILKAELEKKYDAEEVAKRIFATTDKEKGALKTLADQEDYATFVVPDDVGGRFSVLTAVGLLPIAAAGIDVDDLMQGAESMRHEIEEGGDGHSCVTYAAMRNTLYEEGKKIEAMVNYDPTMHFFAEWWKQLFGESEGKEHKGLFPTALDFTTDLHSMGQYVQEGERHLFETVVTFTSSATQVTVPKDEKDLDALNYIAGKPVHDVCGAAIQGTINAHHDGGVPQIIIAMPEKNPHAIGQLIYFFEYACALSAYTLGVNPFDQPGVEAYKKNMFALLGKSQ